MITVQRRFQWSMGHTLKDHQGPCRHLHGHNYVGYFTIAAPDLDDQGMVLDFAKIKEYIGEFIDTSVDHLFFVNITDPRLVLLEQTDPESLVVVPFNPTAENLSEWLCMKANALLESLGMFCVQVDLWETENCLATYTHVGDVE